MPWKDTDKREAQRRANRRWYERHAEQARQCRRAYYQRADKEQLALRMKAYRKAKPHITRTHDQRKWYKQYGITPEQKAALLTAQENRCAVCLTTKPGGRGWHIDHDHYTHVIRGVLCHSCNVGIGFMKDDPGMLAMAIRYLNHPPGIEALERLRQIEQHQHELPLSSPEGAQ